MATLTENGPDDRIEAGVPLRDARPHVSLVARAQSGDREAEREICRRLLPAIRAFAYRRLRGAAAEDFAQEALVAFVTALRAGRISDPAAAPGFALGICRNLAAEQVRTDVRRRALVERFGPSHLPSDEAATYEAPWAAAPAFDAGHLEDCLSRLTRRGRDVVRATFYDDASDAVIAADLDVSEANVRVIRHRTLAALRECLARPISWTER